MAGPGAMPPDCASIPSTKRTRPYWPRGAVPLAG